MNAIELNILLKLASSNRHVHRFEDLEMFNVILDLVEKTGQLVVVQNSSKLHLYFTTPKHVQCDRSLSVIDSTVLRKNIADFGTAFLTERLLNYKATLADFLTPVHVEENTCAQIVWPYSTLITKSNRPDLQTSTFTIAGSLHPSECTKHTSMKYDKFYEKEEVEDEDEYSY